MKKIPAMVCVLIMCSFSLTTLPVASASLEDGGTVQTLSGRVVSWFTLDDSRVGVLFADGNFEVDDFSSGFHSINFEINDLGVTHVAKADMSNSLIAIGTNEGIIVINLATTSMIENFTTEFPVTALAWDIDGDLWIGMTGGSRNALEYRAGVATGQSTQSHSIGITDITVLSDGRIATSGNDEKILVDDLSGNPPITLTDHDDRVLKLATDSSGRLLSTSANGALIRHSPSDLWSTEIISTYSSNRVSYLNVEGEEIHIGGDSGKYHSINGTNFSIEEEFSIGGQIRGAHRGLRGELYLIAALSSSTNVRLFDIDSDDDGVVDSQDKFPNDTNETEDSDIDGVGDNGDAFPDDPSETQDSDDDGVGDNSDVFPNDKNETLDRDGDDIGDNADPFPDDGTQWADADRDGLGDNPGGSNPDDCPGVNGHSQHDRRGCPDSDNDGWSDGDESWPVSPNGSADTFPSDGTQWADSDSDGFGDNLKVKILDPDIDGEWKWMPVYRGDSCPTQPGESKYMLNATVSNITGAITGWTKIDQFGCLDGDGDGYADHGDHLPEDGNEYLDMDGDGLGAKNDFDDNDASVKTKEDWCHSNPSDNSDYCAGLLDAEYQAYVAETEAEGGAAWGYYSWKSNKESADSSEETKESAMDSRIEEALTYGGIAFVGLVALLLIFNGIMNMGRKRSFNKSFGEDGFSPNASLAELAAQEAGESYEGMGGVVEQGNWGDEVQGMEFQATSSLDSMGDVAAESESMDYSTDANFESMAGLPSQPVQQAASVPTSATPVQTAPAQAPPIPASGLPPGWTEEQWKWYGHEWLAQNPDL